MKKILTIVVSLILLLSSYRTVFAINDPTALPNNKVGIHIFSEKDLENAEKLVNSNGGDWGYVTIVITEGERDHDRWQQVFDQMRRLHLIPIVRLATKANGGTWDIPKEEEINNWIAFLNSLNWVIQNRYIVIGNEPNHASEWGGKVDPAGYATYLKDFSAKLRQASTDFYVLPAGLDASAKNQTGTMEESKFLKLMVQSSPDVFDSVDGWTSHSYPNPDFSGQSTDSGKGSIKTYDWELSYLQSLKITKSLPVFITETGWSNSVDASQIGQNLTFAFQNVWNDPRVVAVTPFILDYPNPPFDNLSWEKKDGSFYSYFDTVKNLTKTKGAPVQLESGQILAAFAQPVVPIGSDFLGAILAKNTGQSIWNANINLIRSDLSNTTFASYSFSDIEPTRIGLIIFKATAPENTGLYSQSVFLAGTKGQRITNSFPIEAVLVKIDWNSIQSFFGRILPSFNLKF